MLPDQGSNLEPSDSESGVLPIPPSGKMGVGVFERANLKLNPLPVKHYLFIFVHESRKGTVLLNTRFLSAYSRSTQK